MPSRASPSQVSVSTMGFSLKLMADWLTRAQWRSRSGVTPSKARAPSNTVEPSQSPWVRGPMIGTLPSCHWPWKNVHVCEWLTGLLLGIMTTLHVGDRVTVHGPPGRYPTDRQAGDT